MNLKRVIVFFGIQHNIIIGSTKSMPRWKILIRKGV